MIEGEPGLAGRAAIERDAPADLGDHADLARALADQLDNVESAEIDRVAADRRFVQVIVPVQTEIPLGRSVHKPIFEALVRHGLPLGIHAGAKLRNLSAS